MTTSTASPANADEAESLDDQLRRLSRAVIDQELKRLTRRAPSMTDADVQTVTTELHDLVERLLVGRATALPHQQDRLRELFGLSLASTAKGTTPPDGGQ